MENSLLESKIQLYNSLNEERKRIGREIAVAKVNSFFKQNKKKLIRKTIAWLMPFVLTAIGGYYIITYIPTPEIIHKTKVITVEGKEKTHQEFLAKLADFESKGSYTIVNSFGYMGKYQIGRQALTEIGFGTISKEDFLSSPELQEIAMKMLLKKNKLFLQSYIGKFNSKTIAGIYITESGLLAGAHAVGHVAVIKWLESKGTIDEKDGNGVKVSSRIKQFSAYKLIL